jgi:hypothetical protein
VLFAEPEEQHAVFAPETTAFLEGGCSLVVGTVGAGNEPTAARGWGLTVLSRESGDCRLVLDLTARRTRADLTTTGAIAVTAADVPTLRSIQLKGVALEIEPATDADRERAREYRTAFFGDVHRTDGTDLGVLNRMFPADFFVCVVRFSESYDQTPGPVAGAPISMTRS